MKVGIYIPRLLTSLLCLVAMAAVASAFYITRPHGWLVWVLVGADTVLTLLVLLMTWLTFREPR